MSKPLLSKLSTSEKAKLTKLIREDKRLEMLMLTAQREYTVADRKNILPKSKLDALANKGFKYQKKAFESADKLNKYLDQLKRKYQ